MSATNDLIKRLTDSGLSQSEIARRTQIPQPRISRWANGEVPAGADDALKLADLVRSLPEQAAPTEPAAAQQGA